LAQGLIRFGYGIGINLPDQASRQALPAQLQAPDR
jgi:hypothetical protein